MEAGFAPAKLDSAEVEDRTAATFWESLRQRLSSVVRDCNCAAGETIWSITEAPYTLEVRSITGPPALLKLLFDTGRKRLCCKFGVSQTCRWRFRFLADRMALRRAATIYSVEDLVNAILDRLVTPAGAD